MSLLLMDSNGHVCMFFYVGVFEPFCCSRTLGKCQDHSRIPMQWFVSPAA